MSQETNAPEVELGEHEAIVRGEDGWIGKVVFGLGVLISLMHIYFNVFAVIPGLWQNALHFAGFVLMGALIYPMFGRGKSKGLLVFDLSLGILGAFAALYMISMEDAIYERGVRLDTPEWIFGTLAILVAIEFTRRTTGWIIPILIVLALTYIGWWGALIDGVFKFKGLSTETILFRSIYGDDGLFGNIARISSTFVFMFILFGAFLVRSGAGEFIIDLARVVAGRTVGGPGLVAVFASGLTGTISGSAVANTASTGVITIPLMKKAGFPARFAGGVEAAASTGGQLMPPIMGAGAFVMASYTQIPYTTIIAVSFLPAILYFATVAFFVVYHAIRPQPSQCLWIRDGVIVDSSRLPYPASNVHLVCFASAAGMETDLSGFSLRESEKQERLGTILENLGPVVEGLTYERVPLKTHPVGAWGFLAGLEELDRGRQNRRFEQGLARLKSCLSGD